MTEKIIHKALDKKVLAIAVINTKIGDWSAYIGAVPGINHEREKEEMMGTSTKLDKRIAMILFGAITEGYRWRD
jgi:hypothetical protein